MVYRFAKSTKADIERYQCGGNDMAEIIKINNEEEVVPVGENGLMDITEGEYGL